jgi:hypothetical protein
MRASVYIATSVDGFIAREDGSIDWLPVGDSNSDEDYGYQDLSIPLMHLLWDETRMNWYDPSAHGLMETSLSSF